MERDEAAAQWRAFDQVLSMLNGLHVDGLTADEMRRKIYGEVISMRPIRTAQSPVDVGVKAREGGKVARHADAPEGLYGKVGVALFQAELAGLRIDDVINTVGNAAFAALSAEIFARNANKSRTAHSPVGVERVEYLGGAGLRVLDEQPVDVEAKAREEQCAFCDRPATTTVSDESDFFDCCKWCERLWAADPGFASDDVVNRAAIVADLREKSQQVPSPGLTERQSLTERDIEMMQAAIHACAETVAKWPASPLPAALSGHIGIGVGEAE